MSLPEKRQAGLDVGQAEKVILNSLEQTAELVNPLINHYTRCQTRTLQKMVDYAIQCNKHLERSLLVELSCKAVGGSFRPIANSAAAVELFHLSTLVLDDILDRAPLRSGRKTLDRVYGIANAVIVAEFLNSAALDALSELFLRPELERARIVQACKGFSRTYHDLYHGQYLDLSLEKRLDTTETQYLDVITKSTASLIKLSVELGALLGGGSLRQISCLQRYGEELGKAFQIRDDVLDVIGDSLLIGKQVGGDLARVKMRLPVICALSRCKGSTFKRLRRLLRSESRSRNTIRELVEILIESGSTEYCKKTITDFAAKSIRHLVSLKDTPAKRGLSAFATIISFSW
jgi:geranylgeranyl pyrophosphate synthase